MEEKMYVYVTNKSTGLVVYSTSFGRREFNTRQTRKIALEELKELSQMRGGATLLANYLFIEDPEIMAEELEIKTEPEYYIKEDDLPAWIESCTLDEFKDALDFAPSGTKDLIQKFAVTMPLNDYSKRQAIKDQLGFDVSEAIEALKPDKEEEEKEKPTGRRVQTTESAPQRRTKIIVPNKK